MGRRHLDFVAQARRASAGPPSTRSPNGREKRIAEVRRRRRIATAERKIRGELTAGTRIIYRPRQSGPRQPRPAAAAVSQPLADEMARREIPRAINPHLIGFYKGALPVATNEFADKRQLECESLPRAGGCRVVSQRYLDQINLAAHAAVGQYHRSPRPRRPALQPHLAYVVHPDVAQN